MSLHSYLAAMPKAELHVHLEGSTQPETLFELAERNGIKLPAANPDALREHYHFRDFPHFIEIYMMIINCLRTEQDFSDLVYRFGGEMARQNIRYAEVTWTPQFYVRGELQMPFPVLLDAINDGRRRANEQWGVDMRWIPDIVRNLPQYKEDVTDWVCSPAARDGGVVALGLGGFEVGYPPELFEAQYRRAREQHGIPGNPHAGETMGAESVWGAIHSLQSTRIGHGVRAIEDPALVRYLAEHQIPLEINPTSNLCLNVFPAYAQHPLKKLIEAGCLVTVNSDDPPLFNTTLTAEYIHAIEDCGLSLHQLEEAALNAVRVSYLADEQKNALLGEFQAAYAQLRQQHGVMSDV